MGIEVGRRFKIAAVGVVVAPVVAVVSLSAAHRQAKELERIM